MDRKLIKQGSTSLVVSMPIEWIRSQNLKVGDKIDIEHYDNKVIIKTKQESTLHKYNLNVETVDEMTLYIYLLNLYRRGFDEVKIISKSGKIMDYEISKKINTLKCIQKWLPRFIGWEIITQEPLIIKDITGKSSENPEKLLRRVFFLLNVFVDEEVEALKNSCSQPNSIEFYITTFKLINYAIRRYNQNSQTINKIILLQHLHAIAQQLRDLQPYLKSNFKAILPILLLLRPTLNLYNSMEPSAFIEKHYRVGLELNKLKLNNNLMRMLLRLHQLYLDMVYTFNLIGLEAELPTSLNNL